MKKDEVIELLKEQIKELRDDNNRLLDQIDDLIIACMGVKCRQLKTSTFQTLVVQEKAITIPTQYFYTLPVFAKE